MEVLLGITAASHHSVCFVKVGEEEGVGPPVVLARSHRCNLISPARALAHVGHEVGEDHDDYQVART